MYDVCATSLDQDLVIVSVKIYVLACDDGGGQRPSDDVWPPGELHCQYRYDNLQMFMARGKLKR